MSEGVQILSICIKTKEIGLNVLAIGGVLSVVWSGGILVERIRSIDGAVWF